MRQKPMILLNILYFQLSEIAEEARTLADRHEERSKAMEELAQKAMNASKQAVLEADEAVWGGMLFFQKPFYCIINTSRTTKLLQTLLLANK